MTTGLTFNPYVMTAANNGMFSATSGGGRQGTGYPDPATRFGLRGGVLSAAETLPMWGGVGIYEYVPGGNSYTSVPGGTVYQSASLGPVVGRATGLTGAYKLAGFSVFDQAYGMITSPQSPVPLIGAYGQVMSYALGSRARIWVQCDPSLVDLRQANIAAQVSWDFTNQLLVPYLGTLTISSGTYVSATGVITLTMSAPITFGPGDSVTLSSLTGSGAYASLDGTWTAIAGTTGSTVVLQGPVGAGSATISGGSATVGGAADAALPVTVLDVQTTNCETVLYNSTTGFATWSYNGCAAVIQLTGGTTA
jgi:hypothetical protein